MLFTLRHKQGNRGIQLQLVELKEPTDNPLVNLRLAEAIGRAYCDRTINSQFIRVEQAVVADELILSPAEYKRIITPPKPVERQKLKPGDKVPDNPPAEVITDDKPKFDGNLDELDLGPDEEEGLAEPGAEETAEATDEGETTEDADAEEAPEEVEEEKPKRGRGSRGGKSRG